MNDATPVEGRGRAGSVHEAITSRRSMRAFLPDPVPDDIIRDILQTAGRAPSGSNTQPWRVYVTRDAARRALCDEIAAAYEAGDEHQFEYNYYATEWREP